VQISVVCMFECPSQSDTLRKSLVAWRIVSAQVWRRACGETRFVARDGHRFAAVQTYLRSMYSKPERVMEALRNSSGARRVPRTASHARKADAVSFHNGRQRDACHP